MKAKLLKKVRNRYSIEKIENLDKCYNEYYLGIKNAFGLPFYLIVEGKCNDIFYHSDYNKVYNTLINIIKQKYGNKNVTTKKVWWIKK